MRRSSRNILLCAPFVAITFLTVWRVQCRVPALPLDQWSIPQLVEQLNRAGLELRTAAVSKEGPFDQSVYLTSTERDWLDLNTLVKDPKRIHEWRGIVYCARKTTNGTPMYPPECEPYSLEVGPFFFYGDTEMLARIAAALGQRGPA
jgi:hypothetical protein